MRSVVQVEGNMLPEMVLNLLTVNWWVRKSSRGTDFQEERAHTGMRWFLRLRLCSQCFQGHGVSQPQKAVRSTAPQEPTYISQTVSGPSPSQPISRRGLCSSVFINDSNYCVIGKQAELIKGCI